MKRLSICLLSGCIVLGLLIVSACENNGTSQPQENSEQQSGETVAPSVKTSPVYPVPPAEPKPANSVPATPTQSNRETSQPPPNLNPPTSDSLDATALITKQAYQMTLTLDDMGPGWARGSAIDPASPKVTSTSHVYYMQGSAFASSVQNTVTVYRDIQAAVNAYTSVKPSGVSLLYPDIGNECFLNNSAAINRLLVFRKSNVVVWVWLNQYKTGDIEGYARIVEKRITP